MFLRNSTSQVIRFGPFLDSTDGVTPETGLTIAQADMQLSKDGGAFAQKNTTGNATHDTDGWYSTTLDTTDTGTDGELIMQVNVIGALPVWVRYEIVSQTYYDAIQGTYNNISPAEVNAECDTALTDYDGPTNTEMEARTLPAANYFDHTVDQVIVTTNNDKAGYSISGTKTTLDALNDIAAAAIVSGGAINTTAGAVDTVTANTDMRGTDSAFLASSAPTNFSDLAITATTGQVTVGTNNDKTGYSISGTITTLDGLNNFNPATDTVALVTDVTNELSVNIAKINGVTITGDGSGTPFDV